MVADVVAAVLGALVAVASGWALGTLFRRDGRGGDAKFPSPVPIRRVASDLPGGLVRLPVLTDEDLLLARRALMREAEERFQQAMEDEGGLVAVGVAAEGMERDALCRSIEEGLCPSDLAWLRETVERYAGPSSGATPEA
jgi:hypothetical protein